MKTKPEPKFCVICTNVIVAPEPFHEGLFNAGGRVKNEFVHDYCSWMEGVKSLVRALFDNLQRQRQEKAQAAR